MKLNKSILKGFDIRGATTSRQPHLGTIIHVEFRFSIDKGIVSTGILPARLRWYRFCGCSRAEYRSVVEASLT